MTVMSKPTGRGDFLLHAGADERLGVLWERDRQDGAGYKPMDLTGWQATLRLECDGEAVFTTACTTTSDGYAWGDVPASETAALASRAPSGSWSITATDGTSTDMLGWGYYEIEG